MSQLEYAEVLIILDNLSDEYQKEMDKYSTNSLEGKAMQLNMQIKKNTIIEVNKKLLELIKIKNYG